MLTMATSLTRNTWWAVGVMASLAIGALAAGLVFRGEYATTQTVRRSFTIDEDFTAVRKILVRKDAAQQLVVMGGGSEFIDQQWSAGGAEIDAEKVIEADWRIELHGTLRVRTKDEYIGEQELALSQEVEIVRDYLHSEVRLDEPAARLLQYDMKTEFKREGEKSRVDLELTQEILTAAPWFAHGIADRRVRASVDQTLANQEAAIRKLIAENIDDVPLLPLR